MSGHVHPSRPSEANGPSARVRHRCSGRVGRISAEQTEAGEDVRVLFDGDSHPVSVARRALQYLDDSSLPNSRKVLP